MTIARQLSIILPSFRDDRIISAIASIRLFDDANTVRVLVIDGGSDSALLASIKSVLRPDDILVSEPDDGIFDALNKGLDLVETPYIGWLGSDDLFTGAVKSSEVLNALADHDLYVASLYMTSGPQIRRVMHTSNVRSGLVRYGLHNPHYSTFGRAALLCSERFELANLASDIGYFLKVFNKRPNILKTEKVAVLQEIGGFSNASTKKILLVNQAAYGYYREFNNWFVAVGCVALKLGFKFISQMRFRLMPRRWHNEFPLLVSDNSDKLAL